MNSLINFYKQLTKRNITAEDISKGIKLQNKVNEVIKSLNESISFLKEYIEFEYNFCPKFTLYVYILINKISKEKEKEVTILIFHIKSLIKELNKLDSKNKKYMFYYSFDEKNDNFIADVCIDNLKLS
jgi:hypothetical protein